MDIADRILLLLLTTSNYRLLFVICFVVDVGPSCYGFLMTDVEPIAAFYTVFDCCLFLKCIFMYVIFAASVA